MPVGHLRSLVLLIAVCVLPALTVTGRAAPASKASEAIAADLRSKTVDTRRAAALKLRASDKESKLAALPLLIDLLMNEKDGQVRLAVFDIVTSLGPDAAPAVPALVHSIRTNYGGSSSEKSHQDYRAALALSAVGKPAVEGLRGLLSEKKANVRTEAAMGLGRIGPDAKAAIPDLIKLLGDSSESVGREACLALGRMKEAVIEPLIAANASDQEIVRAKAIESLGATSSTDSRVREAVLKACRDSAPKVRAAALKSLPNLNLPPDTLLAVLKENLRHEDDEVRLVVVDLLLARRELLTTLAPEFERLLTNEKADVSRVAAFLLGKLGPQAAPRLIAALRDEKTRIDQIANGLAVIGRPITAALGEALNDTNPRVRRGAALALGQNRPVAPDTAKRLATGLKAPEREVRTDALTAIGSLGPRAKELVPTVRGMLRDDSADVRLKAIEFLAQAAPRDSQLITDLVRLIDDPEPRVSCKAIDTIRGLGPISRDALPAVIGKLKSPNTAVRLAATELVKNHGPNAAQAVPDLIVLLDDPSPELKASVIQTLGLIGKPAQPAFNRLTPLMSSEVPATRESVISAIGSLELEADAVRPVFSQALRDSNLEVRRATMRAIGKLGPQGAIFVPDLILLAEKKENVRSVERLLRRFESSGPDKRTLPDLIKQLDHKQDSVRLLAIKFLALAGENAKDAIPALERMHDDPSVEVRKQADAASKRLKTKAPEKP